MIRHSKSKGYSLAELLVVLVIVGILATVGVAMVTDRKSPSVKAATLNLAATLSDARALARGSGQAVTLTPSGSGASLVLSYVAASGQTGSYIHAADGQAARYSLIDTTGSSTPAAAAITSLQSALQDTKAGASKIFTAGVWSTNVFDASAGLVYAGNGSLNKEAYVAIVGSVNGVPMPKGAVGIILLNASGNIYRYYRTGPGANWQRL